MDNILDGDFNVNIAEVIKQKDLFSVTRLLASSMQTNPYIHPGHFIRDLSNADLQLLLDHIDVEDNDFGNLMLIGMMLTVAEGVALTEEQMHRSVNALVVMLTSESLYRKDLVVLHHDKFSFGEDAGSNVVIQRKEGVDYEGIVRRYKSEGDDE